jgi:predicted RND superfamily exporter protein
MIFEKIAELSIKHNKKVIAFWIVLFLAALPFFLNLSSVLQYNETSMLPSDSEVVRASDIIKEQFPGFESNSSVMIVICADNVTSPVVRDYCLEIGSQASNRSTVPLYDSFLSFYSMELLYMAQFSQQLGPAMFTTLDSVSQISGMIYGVPAMFLTVRDTLENNVSLANLTREQATVHYKAAMGVEGGSEAARKAAEKGLQKAFTR